MNDQPSSRQELYDRIRASSMDEVILEEMVRLGFWPKEGELPSDPANELRRRGELERELRALRKEHAILGDEAAVKKRILKERLAESRRKQKETKQRRLQDRKERAHAWQLKKRGSIGYLGEDVSGGLNDVESDAQRLKSQGLPLLNSVEDLAAATGLEVGHIRFLCFNRKVSQTTHYVRFELPKKTGGRRKISAPMPRLKWLQEWVLRNILAPIKPHAAAHGFVSGRSIVTNAHAHLGAEVVVNVDLADFFPTITYVRVKGLFRALGYSEQLATIFALACTEPDAAKVELDGKTWYVHEGPRRLPQGAPSSPAITNLICRRLDARAAAMADAMDLVYTRYADDFTFSSKDASVDIGRLLGRLNRVIKDENFTIRRDKTRVLRRGRRQEVTGLVINDGRLTVPRDTMRRFRALLFQIERDGPEGKHWGASTNVLPAIQGFASFVMMVDAERGAALLEQVKSIHAKFGPTPNSAGTAPTGPGGMSRSQAWTEHSDARRQKLFRPLPEPQAPEPEPEPEPEPAPKTTRRERRDRTAGGTDRTAAGTDRTASDTDTSASAPPNAASMTKRVIAKFIDLMTVSVIVYGFSRLLGYPVGLLIAYGWYAVSDYSGSVGKLIFRLETTMADTGEPCTIQASLQRNLAIIACALPARLLGGLVNPTIGALFSVATLVVVGVEFSYALQRGSGRRWGDRIAGTRVVDKSNGAASS